MSSCVCVSRCVPCILYLFSDFCLCALSQVVRAIVLQRVCNCSANREGTSARAPKGCHVVQDFYYNATPIDCEDCPGPAAVCAMMQYG
jgi:hypothetical protein